MKNYIDKDLFIKQYKERCDEWELDNCNDCTPISFIKDFPSIGVEDAKWIEDFETGVPVCSRCHSGKPLSCACSSAINHKLSDHEIRYCYYCGSRMCN